MLYFCINRSYDEHCTSWKPIVIATELRKNPHYSRYYNTLTRLLVLGISPFSLLVYFNVKIYYGIQLPVILRQDSVRNAGGTRTDNRMNQENEAARILIGIVVAFIICHSLRVLTDFYEMIYIEDITACHARGKYGVHASIIILTEFSSVMLTLNSSINMIIYGLIKPNIRRHIFKCKNIFTARNQTQEQCVFHMEEQGNSQRNMSQLVYPSMADSITL